MSKHTPEPLAETDHFADVREMVDELVTCHGCNRQYQASSQEAEFIGWHGECAACQLQEDPATEIAELKRQRDELLAALGSAIPLIKQARLDWCDHNAESYDEDVVTPYDAILYRPILSLLETKGSAS